MTKLFQFQRREDGLHRKPRWRTRSDTAMEMWSIMRRYRASRHIGQIFGPFGTCISPVTLKPKL